MIAHFKNENKIIVTGADKAEALLISQLVNNSKASDKKLTLTEFYDIDGDVTGFSIQLEPITEPSKEETGEKGV